jgi:hypothetical protein
LYLDVGSNADFLRLDQDSMGRFPDDVALQTIREVRGVLDGGSAMMQITRRMNILVVGRMIMKYVHTPTPTHTYIYNHIYIYI